MITGSFFGGVRDIFPIALPPVSFDELARCLVEDAVECEPSAKEDQTCISPADFRVGATRSKEAAISWSWFAADIDNKGGNREGAKFGDMIKVMQGLGTPWFIYTTASSQPSAECFRLMFPLDRAVGADEFDAVWRSFSQLLPMDEQTKDISRLFIVPRRWIGRENHMEFDLSGSPVSVDMVLHRYPPLTGSALSKPPPRSSDIKPRARSLNPSRLKSIDAPYVPSAAVDEALFAPQGGRMYRFLVKVAFSALRNGYEIDASGLEAVGRDLARLLGRSTSDIPRDARSAHAFAERNFVDDRSLRSDRLRSILMPARFR